MELVALRPMQLKAKLWCTFVLKMRRFARVLAACPWIIMLPLIPLVFFQPFSVLLFFIAKGYWFEIMLIDMIQFWRHGRASHIWWRPSVQFDQHGQTARWGGTKAADYIDAALDLHGDATNTMRRLVDDILAGMVEAPIIEESIHRGFPVLLCWLFPSVSLIRWVAVLWQTAVFAAAHNFFAWRKSMTWTRRRHVWVFLDCAWMGLGMAVIMARVGNGFFGLCLVIYFHALGNAVSLLDAWAHAHMVRILLWPSTATWEKARRDYTAFVRSDEAGAADGYLSAATAFVNKAALSARWRDVNCVEGFYRKKR